MEAQLPPPAGFTRHYRQSPVTDPWEPLYSRKDAGVVSIGFVAAPAHANSRGFVHGGLITALTDNAMGLSCAETLGDASSLLTVSLAVDFLGSANLGQWVEITPKVNRAGGRLCFVEALVTADGEPCAKAHATFSVGRKPPPPS
jgi:acyl-coenzyme A thioesterase PaaI-like protein